jgi:predicted MFS family arabinose efflux permease
LNLKKISTHLRQPALGGFLALFVGHGLGRFAYPALVPALVQHHWISGSQVGYLGTANLAGYLSGCVYAVRRSAKTAYITPSMIAVAISYLACAFPYGFTWLFCWRYVAGVAGALILTTSIPTIQIQTKPTRRAVVVALAFAGVGVGIVFAGFATPALVGVGVGFASTAMAGIAIGLTALSWRAWDTCGLIPVPSSMPVPHDPSNRMALMLLSYSYATAAIAYVPFVIFWVDYIVRGLNAGIREGALTWMLYGVASALGPLVCAYAATRLGTARALRWTLLVNGVAVVLPLASSRFSILSASVVGAGCMAMGVSTLIAMRVREIVPPQPQQLWARMTIIFAVAFAAGGWIFSYGFATTHDYRTMFAWSGIALASGTLAQYVMPQPRYASSQQEIAAEAA